MNHTKSILLLAAAGLFLSAAPGAHASTVGLDTDPMGSAWDRNTAGTGYGIWDIFSSASPTGDAPASSFGISSLSLAGTTGGIATGGGDRIYLMGAGSSFSITGTTSFDVNGAVLQLKQYASIEGEGLDSIYSPTLNGLAFDNMTVSVFTEGANTQRVITWYWDSSIAAGTLNSLNFSISSDVGFHTSVDAFAVDVGPVAAVPVPEPTAIALLGGTGMLMLLRRRRPFIAG